MLRTALSLSCITGKAFRIVNIRQNRSKPGLMRQHLVAVQAAARVSAARVAGAELGSARLSFEPGPVTPGRYSFDIGTAGATSLVLQTVLPPLLLCREQSEILLTGGTHVPFSPSWNYLAHVFAPTVARLGLHVEFYLDACGFYPKGGGRVRCRIHPAAEVLPFDARRRGRLLRVTGVSAVGNLPRGIAERQARSARERLRSGVGSEVPVEIELAELAIFGQGTFIFLDCQYEEAVAGFTALGARGKPAEAVGEEAADELLRHHATGMPVDPHLADQLVLYLAQARGASLFETSRITSHLETNLTVTARFLDMASQVKGVPDGPGSVLIDPRREGRPGRKGREGGDSD